MLLGWELGAGVEAVDAGVFGVASGIPSWMSYRQTLELEQRLNGRSLWAEVLAALELCCAAWIYRAERVWLSRLGLGPAEPVAGLALF